MKISEIIKLVKKSIPKDIRLYLISKNTHYFINDGKVNSGFSNLKLVPTRISLIDAFSKIEFLFDELIRLKIVGYDNSKSSFELLYLLNLIPINRKIRTFLDWKVFDPKFTKQMSRLFEVRNDIIHSVSLKGVYYVPNRKVSLSTTNGFGKFKKDLIQSWKKLIQIYVNEQNNIDFKKLTKDLV